MVKALFTLFNQVFPLLGLIFFKSDVFVPGFKLRGVFADGVLYKIINFLFEVLVVFFVFLSNFLKCVLFLKW